MLIVSLKLEVITYFRREILKVSFIPNHSYFIYDDAGLRRKKRISNIFRVNLISTRDSFGRIDGITTFIVFERIASKERRFTTPLFSKDKDQFIGVEIFFCTTSFNYYISDLTTKILHL